jgi:hypothetical protein
LTFRDVSYGEADLCSLVAKGSKMVALDVVEIGWWVSVVVLLLAGLGSALLVVRLVWSLTAWGKRMTRRRESRPKRSSVAHQ